MTASKLLLEDILSYLSFAWLEYLQDLARPVRLES